MKYIVEQQLRRLLNLDAGTPLKEVPRLELLRTVYHFVRGILMKDFFDQPFYIKKVIYTTMEILPGRTLANDLMNLPIGPALMEVMAECGVGLNELEEMEEEPKLGNGGLGRLSACMIESAASHSVPLEVSTIRFRTGLFKQKIEDGRQVEENDQWLDEKDAYAFEMERQGEKQRIRFVDQGRAVEVEAIACDLPVVGARRASHEKPHVNYIRMWKVGAVYAGEGVDLDFYRRIDDRLYPDDTNPEGKRLRLCQEYFLSAATVGCMLQRMSEKGWDMETLPDHFVLHMNDTHPVLMIPVLLRALRIQHGMKEDAALALCRKVFVYTNHTIMAEALEKWDISLTEQMLPEIYQEIHSLHRRFEAEIKERYPEDHARMENMDILWDGKIRMANMAIYASGSVNGVARIHTEILKQRELKFFDEFFPGKFTNVTNGVTQRKFLGHANPELSGLIDQWTGSDQWRVVFDCISMVGRLAGDPHAQGCFAAAHLFCKERLRRFILQQRGIDLPVHFLYDVQIKRLHEYKRQSLNCLKIISLYQQLKSNPEMKIAPTAFIFAGKAAAAYGEAKLTIELILALERQINKDPDVNHMMRVAFVEDYGVAKAELIFAAADCSEQISTASKEASGTGNMKFMMNGAVTLGTLDGANVEIFEAVGAQNMFLFGLTKEEVMAYEREPGSYDPMDELVKSAPLCAAVKAMTDGTLRRFNPAPGEEDSFRGLTDEWLYGKNGGWPDRYFVLKDFSAYMTAFMKLNRAFEDFAVWNRMCLNNIAGSAAFSSDCMVHEYAEKVWHIDPVIFGSSRKPRLKRIRT